MFKKQYITGAFLAVISLFSSCTNLDEEIFSSIPEKDFYKTESEFLAAMVPIYSSMRTLTEHSNWWDLEETTDVCVTPVKNHGLWYDGGIYIRLHQHSWMEEDAHLNNFRFLSVPLFSEPTHQSEPLLRATVTCSFIFASGTLISSHVPGTVRSTSNPG